MSIIVMPIVAYTEVQIFCLFREAFVELICDHDVGAGEETLTTTGDSENALHYVSL